MNNCIRKRQIMIPVIEACVTSVHSAISAIKGGAVRVELCDNLYEGGTTPGPGSIVAARNLIKSGLHIIIRPRGGDFLYSDLEFEIMLEEIRYCREKKIDGVVFGILTSDGSIDLKRTARCVREAGTMSLTFHRAFDVCNDPFKAVDQLKDLGFHRILTSGQKPSAIEGASLIANLVKHTKGQIQIMPGVGITSANIGSLIQQTGATEYHIYESQPVDSKMSYRNPSVFMGTDAEFDEYNTSLTSENAVRAICQAARKTHQ